MAASPVEGCPPIYVNIPDLRGGAKSWLAVIVPMATAAAFVGSLIWTMARNPDRPEFNRLKEQVTEIKEAQISTTKDTASITKAVDRIEAKVDKLADKRAR